jgi:hypothetical protein
VTASTLFKFVRRRRNGDTIEYATVKDAFDARERDEVVGIVLIATGSFFPVLRP